MTMARSRRDEVLEREDPKGREGLIAVTDEDRDAILRDEAMNNSLPNLPTIPGWHTVWLSTTNQYTPIQWYQRLGYVPVSHEDVPGMDGIKVHSGEMSGFVSINEMVAYKIPDDAYQQIMRVHHHERPNSEAERMQASFRAIKETTGVDSAGNSVAREISVAEGGIPIDQIGDRKPSIRGRFE
jgi:hypothetical protein